MNEFQAALMIGLVATGLISSRLPRAWLWLLCGFASFVASTAYARFGLLYPPAFTLVCDASVCLAVYFFGKERWEENLYRVFQLSVLISLLHMSHFIADHRVYVIALELLNWAALLLIGGTAILDRARGHGGITHRDWHPHFHRSDLALRRSRQTQPFHRVKK
jgi:hypothetical protein